MNDWLKTRGSRCWKKSIGSSAVRSICISPSAVDACRRTASARTSRCARCRRRAPGRCRRGRGRGRARDAGAPAPARSCRPSTRRPRARARCRARRAGPAASSAICVDGVRAGGLGAPADAAVVEDDRAVVLARSRAPGTSRRVESAASPMMQQQRIAAAVLLVVQLDVADGRSAHMRGLIAGRHRGRQSADMWLWAYLKCGRCRVDEHSRVLPARGGVVWNTGCRTEPAGPGGFRWCRPSSLSGRARRTPFLSSRASTTSPAALATRSTRS